MSDSNSISSVSCGSQACDKPSQYCDVPLAVCRQCSNLCTEQIIKATQQFGEDLLGSCKFNCLDYYNLYINNHKDEIESSTVTSTYTSDIPVPFGNPHPLKQQVELQSALISLFCLLTLLSIVVVLVIAYFKFNKTNLKNMYNCIKGKQTDHNISNENIPETFAMHPLGLVNNINGQRNSENGNPNIDETSVLITDDEQTIPKKMLDDEQTIPKKLLISKNKNTEKIPEYQKGTPYLIQTSNYDLSLVNTINEKYDTGHSAQVLRGEERRKSKEGNTINTTAEVHYSLDRESNNERQVEQEHNQEIPFEGYRSEQICETATVTQYPDHDCFDTLEPIPQHPSDHDCSHTQNGEIINHPEEDSEVHGRHELPLQVYWKIKQHSRKNTMTSGYSSHPMQTVSEDHEIQANANSIV